MAIKLVNAKINTDAKLNTKKYKHGDTIRLNVILTYRNDGEATEITDTAITCDYIQFYKDTSLGTWVSTNKTATVTITEPTGTFNFGENIGSSVDVNSFDVSNSIKGILEVNGYLDVILENPEYGNSFKFQFTNAITGASGYKYSYDLPADRIVSVNDNSGNKFNVKTDVNSIFRNGVSIKDYIPYRFVYSGEHTFINGVTPSKLEVDGGIYSSGHILVLDSQEGVSVPNGPFIAIFECPTQINASETLTFVFGPDKNSNVTKAFVDSLIFNTSELNGPNVDSVDKTGDIHNLYGTGTTALVLVDPNGEFNSMYPINSGIQDYEIVLEIEIKAITAPITFGYFVLPEVLKTPGVQYYSIINKNDESECSITLNAVGDYYSLDGYIISAGSPIDSDYSAAYYKKVYSDYTDVIQAINSLSECKVYVTKEDITDSNPLTDESVKFLVKLTYSKKNDLGRYTYNVIGG